MCAWYSPVRRMRYQSPDYGSKLQNQVVYSGQLTETDLAPVPRGLALVCPSLYEGFGLPSLRPWHVAPLSSPLISQPCRKWKDAAAFVDPYNVEAIAWVSNVSCRQRPASVTRAKGLYVPSSSPGNTQPGACGSGRSGSRGSTHMNTGGYTEHNPIGAP
jgi:hypothetical protein